MNIVTIMIEFIDKQKIYKRHSFNGSPGLHMAAGGIFPDKSIDRFRKKQSFARGLPARKKRVSHHTPEESKINEKSAPAVSRQSVVKRRKLNFSGFGRFFSSLKQKMSFLSFKVFLITGLALCVIGLAAFITYSWIQNSQMYDSLALPQDVNVDDVLYENLTVGYDGQGSGEIAGIEPVLMLTGEPASYVVQPGDTLSEIARDNNIKIGTLISYNQISDVRRLLVGMELKIPEADGIPYEVKAGDSLSSIASKYELSVNSLLDANDLQSEVIAPGDMLFIPGAVMNEFDYKKAMGTLFIYPTSGRLSSGFGYRPDPFTGQRRFHNGIDLANGIGTRVSATMSGRVAAIGEQVSGYGKYVIIKHANGYQSLYGHMNKITVRKGQYISQGEKIGEMGNTGRSTGPHLHFSIYKNNIPVNPLTYLW